MSANALVFAVWLVTFCIRYSQAKCILVAAICVFLSVCLSCTAFIHYCTHPDVTLGNSRGCTVGRICNRCSGFVAMATNMPNGKCQRVLLVIGLCSFHTHMQSDWDHFFEYICTCYTLNYAIDVAAASSMPVYVIAGKSHWRAAFNAKKCVNQTCQTHFGLFERPQKCHRLR